MNIPIKTADIVAINPRAVIGNNNPPNKIDRARDCYVLLAAFLKETPVITTDADAKKAANFVEQARRTLGEMEDERKQLVQPLNEELEAINADYRTPRDTIKKIVDELKRRLTAFAAAEEERRLQEAERKRLAAQEAERKAREAEAIERAAKDDIDNGVVGVNIATAITQADRAFDNYKRADRTAARAERETTVRLNGGFGRAVSMRTTETLVIEDTAAALKSMGLTSKIKEAILSSARDHRKLYGQLPTGISAVTERQF